MNTHVVALQSTDESLTRFGWIAAVMLGAAAAMVGGALEAVAVVLTVCSLALSTWGPRQALVALLAGPVLLPPFVGWLTPGEQFFNLLRGSTYGALLGFGIWLVIKKPSNHVSQHGQPIRLDIGIMALIVGWVLVVVLSVAHGFSNVFKAANAVLYQAFPFLIGWLAGRRARAHGILQISFVLLVLYLTPFWLYDLATGTSLFRSYVPPLPSLLDARALLLRHDHIRVEATFGHPLALDQFLLIATPIASSLLLVRRMRVVGTLGVLAGMAALVFTRSRSPWIAIVLALLAIAAIRHPKRAIVLILASFLMVSTLVVTDRLPRFSDLVGRNQELTTVSYSSSTETEFSTASRIVLTISSVRAIARAPLAGYGINVTATAAQIPTIDNYYLAFPVEVGLPGAALVVVGVFVLWTRLVRRPAVSKASLLIAWGIGAYFFELLFVGLHDTISLAFLVLGFQTGLVSSMNQSHESDVVAMTAHAHPQRIEGIDDQS